MIDGLMTATEPFLKHESYSSNPGGYSIIVNGIHIHNRKGTWDSINNVVSKDPIGEMLWDFEDFANLTNHACDADDRSFDAMALLTGRGTELLGSPLAASGVALTGQLCEMYVVNSKVQLCYQLFIIEIQ